LRPARTPGSLRGCRRPNSRYKIDIAGDRAVTVDMTLTTPNCPSAQELPVMVENAVASVAGVGEVKVNIVWDPPWDPSRMSDEARAVLNMW
jgi:metal-sulfur cluster biosynthetic enzyme